MRNTNSYGIDFITRNSNKSSYTGIVYARITVNKRRTEISLKRTVPLKDWDEVKGMGKGKSEEVRKLNNHLERMRSQIAECYHELVQKGRVVTAKIVKGMYLGEGLQEFTLGNLVRYHNEHQSRLLADGTMKNYYTTQKYIGKFLKLRKKVSDIHLSELNYQFITDFERFLRSHKPTDYRVGQ